MMIFAWLHFFYAINQEDARLAYLNDDDSTDCCLSIGQVVVSIILGLLWFPGYYKQNDTNYRKRHKKGRCTAKT